MLSVPNTASAGLASKLIRREPNLAKITKYNVKIVEKSGVQLGRLFQRVYTPSSCRWPQCPVCPLNSGKGNSKCRVSNVVYEAKCFECLEMLERGDIQERDVGVYVGETSRTLLERALEHVTAADNLDVDNFITKHWASSHRTLESRPRIKFKVIKQFKDALSRQVSEAVWIEHVANLNSKAEWGKNSLTRLVVDNDVRDQQSSLLDENVCAFSVERKKKVKK